MLSLCLRLPLCWCFSLCFHFCYCCYLMIAERKGLQHCLHVSQIRSISNMLQLVFLDFHMDKEQKNVKVKPWKKSIPVQVFSLSSADSNVDSAVGIALLCGKRESLVQKERRCVCCGTIKKTFFCCFLYEESMQCSCFNAVVSLKRVSSSGWNAGVEREW